MQVVRFVSVARMGPAGLNFWAADFLGGVLMLLGWCFFTYTPTYCLLGYKQAVLVVELWQSVFNHLTLCSVVVGFLNLCRTCATSLSYLCW